MSAWQRIVGTKTAELDYLWIVDAEIFTNRTHSLKARIALQNPPAPEEQEFYMLKQQLAGYDQQYTNDQRAYQSDMKAEQRAQDRANDNARSYHLRSRLSVDAYDQKSGQERDLASQAQDDETQAKQWVTTAEKDLAALPSVHGVYQIDYFALDTGKYFHGLPVYDLGVIYYPAQ